MTRPDQNEPLNDSESRLLALIEARAARLDAGVTSPSMNAESVRAAYAGFRADDFAEFSPTLERLRQRGIIRIASEQISLSRPVVADA